MGGQKSLGFVFGIALAIGVVLAVTTWAAFPKTSERLGRSSEGNDLSTSPLEGVLAGGVYP